MIAEKRHAYSVSHRRVDEAHQERVASNLERTEALQSHFAEASLQYDTTNPKQKNVSVQPEVCVVIDMHACDCWLVFMPLGFSIQLFSAPTLQTGTTQPCLHVRTKLGTCYEQNKGNSSNCNEFVDALNMCIQLGVERRVLAANK